jgi:hypothetical protein
VDAEAGDLGGEAAFQKILSWRAGNFEMLPVEPSHSRTIFKSYNALLLESAQALDESASPTTTEGAPKPANSPLAQLSQIEGVEFGLVMQAGDATHDLARGLENPDRMAAWARQNLERFRALGDRLGAGSLDQIEAFGPQRHVVLACQNETQFCIGWKPSLTPEQVRESMKKVLALWAS